VGSDITIILSATPVTSEASSITSAETVVLICRSAFPVTDVTPTSAAVKSVSTPTMVLSATPAIVEGCEFKFP